MNRTQRRLAAPLSSPTESADRLVARGFACHQIGDLDGAEDAYRAALEADPNHFDALHLLGVMAIQVARAQDAIVLIEAALRQRETADAWNNLSRAYMDAGDPSAGLRASESALRLDPSDADAHYNRGNALRRLDETPAAIDAFRRALAVRPQWPEALNNLGDALLAVGRPEEALLALDAAAAFGPDRPRIHMNRGVALQALGRTDDALEAFAEAVRLKPDYARAHANRSNLLRNVGRLDDALVAANLAAQCAPNDAETWNAVANARLGLAQADDAVIAFERAIASEPENPVYVSNWLMALNYTEAGTPASLRHAAAGYGARFSLGAPRPRKRSGGLRRIGYIGPDFRSHPVGYFIEPVLAEHARGELEVFVYASVAQPDAQTTRLASLGATWRDVAALDDDAVAELIAADGVDLLVDLAGHTADGRMGVLARRPAPVQATWLGYSGTTGMPEVDALVADPWTVPAGEEAFYSERVFRHLASFVCVGRPEDWGEVGPLPALARGGITFGAFNNPAKINAATLRRWAAVVAQVPGARIVFKHLAVQNASLREWISGTMAPAGVQPAQIEFWGAGPRAQHLAQYGHIDLALDTWPYSGATTTVENLWMGVPVVTLRGPGYVGRMSESVLRNVGLAELVTQDEEEFIATAVSWATDLDRLAAVRSNLRTKMAESPLGDAAAYTRALEAVYQDVWSSVEAS